MRRTWLVASAGLLALGAAHAAGAQTYQDDEGSSADAAAAYAALASTPLGGSAPIIVGPLMGAHPAFGWRLQYAQFGSSDLRWRNIVAGIDVPVGASVLGLKAGWNAASCSDFTESFLGDCKGNFLASADWTSRLAHVPMGVAPGSAEFALGLQGAVGYAKPRVADIITENNIEMSSWAASVGVPAAITAPAGSVKIVPYLTPAIGWGRLSASYSGESESYSDIRFLLGGGLHLEFQGGLGLDFGLQKVFIDGGETTFGGGLSWHAR
jgi:hypothetical protein